MVLSIGSLLGSAKARRDGLATRRTARNQVTAKAESMPSMAKLSGGDVMRGSGNNRRPAAGSDGMTAARHRFSRGRYGKEMQDMPSAEISAGYPRGIPSMTPQRIFNRPLLRKRHAAMKRTKLSENH